MSREEEEPMTRYHLSAEVDLTAAFSTFDIEYLPVTGNRVITIYGQTIFNLEIVDETLENARVLDITVIDPPAEGDTDTTDSLVEPMLGQVCITEGVEFRQTH